MNKKMPPRIVGITILEIIAFSFALFSGLSFLFSFGAIADVIIMRNNVSASMLFISNYLLVTIVIGINIPNLVAAIFNFKSKKSSLNVLVMIAAALKIFIYLIFIILISRTSTNVISVLFIPIIIINGILIALIAVEMVRENKNKEYTQSINYNAIYNTDIIYCKYCGTKLKQADKFCPSCGQQQDT